MNLYFLSWICSPNSWIFFLFSFLFFLIAFVNFSHVRADLSTSSIELILWPSILLDLHKILRRDSQLVTFTGLRSISFLIWHNISWNPIHLSSFYLFELPFWYFWVLWKQKCSFWIFRQDSSQQFQALITSLIIKKYNLK